MTDNTQNFQCLTALRAFFAWWVVLYHVRHWLVSTPLAPLVSPLNYGFLGVDFFFVLSGFVIHYRYAEFFPKFNSTTLQKFFVLRLARIYPLHLFILLLFLLNPLAIAIFSTTGASTDRYQLSYFFMSILLIQNWGIANEIKWNGPAWSISTEAFAYLVYPLVCYCLLRTKARFIASLFCILLLSFLLFVFAWQMHLNSIGEKISQFGLVRCTLEFVIGCFVCAMFKSMAGSGATPKTNRWITWSAPALFALVMISAWIFRWVDFAFIPITVALLIFSIATWHQSLRYLAPKPLVWLGEISYATYLVHYFIKDWYGFLNIEPKIGSTATLVSYCVTVLIASAILHRTLERPMQGKLKKLLWPRRETGEHP